MELAGHSTATGIFEAANRVDPRCSRRTTFNNLRDLAQAGLVLEVAVAGRATRFDVKGMRQHHFICNRCGKVEDLKWCDVPRPVSGPDVSGFIGNANSFSVGLARSVLRRPVSVGFRKPVDTGLMARAHKARPTAIARTVGPGRVRVSYPYFLESSKGA